MDGKSRQNTCKQDILPLFRKCVDVMNGTFSADKEELCELREVTNEISQYLVNLDC